MGVHDRDWYHDRNKNEPQNPNWKKEYARWYGKPPHTNTGVHWTLRLMICAAVFMVVYAATKQLFFTRATPATQPAPTIEKFSVALEPTRPPVSTAPAPIAAIQPQPTLTPKPAPAPQPHAPAQQPGIDPYTAALARQADERIARQNAEAQFQQNALNRRAMNNGRCAELANDHSIITEWLRTAGSDADRARFRVLLQQNQSDMLRVGC